VNASYEIAISPGSPTSLRSCYDGLYIQSSHTEKW
jgi:hypothetical protein